MDIVGYLLLHVLYTQFIRAFHNSDWYGMYSRHSLTVWIDQRNGSAVLSTLLTRIQASLSLPTSSGCNSFQVNIKLTNEEYKFYHRCKTYKQYYESL